MRARPLPEKPVLIPLAERLGRAALRRRGVESRWVVTPQGRLHAYDARGGGDLPTTVLLHGIGSSATAFGRVLARLRGEVRRVVAPEYPGHGFSDGAGVRMTPDQLFDAVNVALGALVDEPAVLVGNSLGGAVALRYALDRPERVRALVLVSPAGARATDEEWAEIRRSFDMKSRADAKAFVARLYHRTPWLAALLAHELPAAMRRREIRELLESASNDHAPSPEALTALPMPVLLLWGRSERLLPDAHFDWFARHLPRHAVVERPVGFGHCPHLDDPAGLAARIARFARDAR